MIMRRVNTVSRFVTIAAFVGASFLAWWFLSTEAIKVRAVDSVPLFDPSSLAGKIGDTPKLVGQLNSGDELTVVGCMDRKSDINIFAFYDGQVVAIGEWKARVILLRHHVFPWQQGATTSCRGFFDNISKQQK